MSIITRAALAVALALAAIFAAAGTALADPGDGYVSGYDGAGMVTMRSTTPSDSCATRRAIYVVHTDDPEVANGAQRADSAPGMGWACVNRATYDQFTIGQWWPGRPHGPRG